MTDKNLFNVLKERGLLYQCTDEETLKKRIESGEPITLYEGTDPTADSLHIGHCVPYCILRRFQQAGHKVVLLMGGATACIGDPSGKQEMRKMMTKEDIQNNIEKIKDTLKVFLKFDGENPAIIVNNADWFNSYSYIDFMREIGVHFNVNPNCTSFCFAHLLAVWSEKQWVCRTNKIDVCAVCKVELSLKFNTSNNVAPLILTTILQSAAIFSVEMNKVICLHQHITHFKESQTTFFNTL